MSQINGMELETRSVHFCIWHHSVVAWFKITQRILHRSTIHRLSQKWYYATPGSINVSSEIEEIFGLQKLRCKSNLSKIRTWLELNWGTWRW